MTAVSEYFKTKPILVVTGGMDFDYAVELVRVTSSVTDGRLTELQRLGAYDFTGWTAFAGAMRSYDGTLRELVSVVIDGPETEGVLRIRGSGRATWRMQVAGARGGLLTIRGTAPSGQKLRVIPALWHLEPGSTDPDTQSVADFTQLR